MSARGPLPTGVVIALMASTAGCSGDDGGRAVDVEVESPTVATSAPSADPSSTAASPADQGVRVRVPSHCGVLSVTIEGRLWIADPPLGDDNPPPGWDENETAGLFVKTGPRRAVFKGDGGQRATFKLADPGVDDPAAGCE